MNRQNLLTLLATFALLFCFTYFCNAKGKDKAKHVVFIGLDGWGAYSLPKADMPNVKKLMEDGSYTLKKRSALPSSSAINWASMFMGAGPELHGYTEWGSKTPELPSRVLNKNGIFPTVFQLLRDARPEAEIGCLYEWEGIACCPGWNRPCRWIVDKCICPCRVVLKPEFADTIPAMEEDIVLADIYEFRSTVAFRKRNRRILFVICFV